jgi:hypothetical protein
MENIDSYLDARLRDLIDAWVVFAGAELKAPKETIRMKCQLLGYVYVDHGTGFRLRIEHEVFGANHGRLILGTCLADLGWEIGYDAMKHLLLRLLPARECARFRLPVRPQALYLHYDSGLSRCRRLPSLDWLRAPGHPDIVNVWLKVGGAVCGELVRARLEGELFEGIYECTLLSAPQVGGDYVEGERITAAEYELAGRRALFCIGRARGYSERRFA